MFSYRDTPLPLWATSGWLSSWRRNFFLHLKQICHVPNLTRDVYYPVTEHIWVKSLLCMLPLSACIFQSLFVHYLPQCLVHINKLSLGFIPVCQCHCCREEPQCGCDTMDNVDFWYYFTKIKPWEKINNEQVWVSSIVCYHNTLLSTGKWNAFQFYY